MTVTQDMFIGVAANRDNDVDRIKTVFKQTLNNTVTPLSYRDARFDFVKQGDEKRQQEKRLVSDLWAWLTLLAVVGSYLMTWLFLLILKALQT